VNPNHQQLLAVVRLGTAIIPNLGARPTGARVFVPVMPAKWLGDNRLVLRYVRSGLAHGRIALRLRLAEEYPESTDLCHTLRLKL